MISTSRNNYILRCVGGLFLSIFLLIPATLAAQEAVTLSVSPTIFDMTGNPGQTWSSTVRIINVNPFELTVSVAPANFEPKGEAGLPKFNQLIGDETEEGSFAKWISIEKEVKIGAEKTAEVPFTITVPNDASPGGHYAALMIKTIPTAGNGTSTNVQTSQVVSSLIFLRVTGDVLEHSTVRSFRTTHYLLSKPEATFELRIENKGNVHLQPQGEIKIFNMWGQERGVIPVNQKTLLGNVLPKSVRKFSFEWKGDWSLSDIGRYTAVATLAYGNDTRQFIAADTAFWIIPWKLMLLVVVGLGGFAWLFVWGIKLYIRRMLSLAGIDTGQTIAPYAAAPLKIAKTPARGRGRPKKVAEVVAPIEVGILDLRTRLKGTKNIKDSLTVFGKFVHAYWKFFVVAAAVVFFVYGLSWFVRGALTPSRDYQVTIEEEGKSVTVTKQELEEQASNTVQEPDAVKALVPILLVNRGANEAALEEAKKTLTEAGFLVQDLQTDTDTAQDKTVIVYNKDVEVLALEIEKLFDGALLSALTNNTSNDNEIIVYLGADIVQ